METEPAVCYPRFALGMRIRGYDAIRCRWNSKRPFQRIQDPLDHPALLGGNRCLRHDMGNISDLGTSHYRKDILGPVMGNANLAGRLRHHTVLTRYSALHCWSRLVLRQCLVIYITCDISNLGAQLESPSGIADLVHQLCPALG